MSNAFDKELIAYADGMGVSLYQRFSVQEASLFLRTNQDEINKLIRKNHISFIQVTKTEVQFFGFQLIEYLISQTKQAQTLPKEQHITNHANPSNERIIRFKEVQQMVGLSRTTIWRKQKSGEFPQSVPLGVGSVGWYKSEIERWVQERR